MKNLLFRKLLKLRNRHFLLIDISIFLLTPLLALSLRLDGSFALEQYKVGLAIAVILFLTVKVSILISFGFYKHYWRYASSDEMAHMCVLMTSAIVIDSILFNALYYLNLTNISINSLPRSLPLLDGILSFLFVAGLRFSIAEIERANQRKRKFHRHEPVLIVGAGSSGVALAKEMQRSPWLGFQPVAFIDDNPEKLNLKICSLPIVGNRHKIPDLVRTLKIRKAIIAMPTVPGRVIREIQEICQSIGVQTSILPGMNEILNGNVRLSNVRDIEIEDLLRREPIQTDIEKISKFLGGKKVLITGAGGSIGSELCRQVLKCHPAELILIGHGENSVFNIQQELEQVLALFRKKNENQETIPHLSTLIADIRFPERLEYVFNKFQPDIIFHAAAHKHVPMMELNSPEAITNNVQGTQNLLNLALQYGVEHFVMISTDKAVNPTSVMGASKRVAEMLVLTAARLSKKPFVVVRFGNVLGSRGSVVPTFKQQIAKGGPITITHPEITRYFMTIPEAVQLVLQAAVIGHGGEVFMLNMGQPIKIVDLAKDIIRLSGYELGKDIDIAFTGLRPGEKLFEELFIPGEQYDPTQHEKILTVGNASRLITQNIETQVKELCQAAVENDTNLIVSLLKQLVPEYTPKDVFQEKTNTHEEKSERKAKHRDLFDTSINESHGVFSEKEKNKFSF